MRLLGLDALRSLADRSTLEGAHRQPLLGSTALVPIWKPACVAAVAGCIARRRAHAAPGSALKWDADHGEPVVGAACSTMTRSSIIADRRRGIGTGASGRSGSSATPPGTGLCCGRSIASRRSAAQAQRTAPSWAVAGAAPDELMTVVPVTGRAGCRWPAGHRISRRSHSCSAAVISAPSAAAGDHGEAAAQRGQRADRLQRARGALQRGRCWRAMRGLQRESQPAPRVRRAAGCVATAARPDAPAAAGASAPARRARSSLQLRGASPAAKRGASCASRCSQARPIRDHQLGGARGCGRAHVRHEIGDGEVDLVADAGHDRNRGSERWRAPRVRR